MISENQNKLLNILENCTGTEKYNSSLSILKHEIELKENISDSLKKSLETIKKTVDNFNQDLDISYIQKEDPILDEIIAIVGNKVSTELPSEKLEEIYKEGDERFKKEIPPGYKDKDKDGNSKFNDLVIWKEIIELSKIKKSDILFISDDRKEDWAIKFKGKDFGPRNELLKEFLKDTNQLFYSITTKRFIEIISSIHSISDTELLIKETENITKNIYEKEKLVLDKIQQLKLEREKFEKELFKNKLRDIYFKDKDKKNSELENKYYRTFINYNDIQKDEFLKKDDSEDEMKELKEKFIWNYLKDYHIKKDDDDDDNDDHIFYTFEKED